MLQVRRPAYFFKQETFAIEVIDLMDCFRNSHVPVTALLF